MSETEARYTTPNTVLVRKVADEVILLNTETEGYFSLDAVGAIAHAVLSKGGTMTEAVDLITNEFDIDVPTVQVDLAELIDTLQEMGLLVEDVG